MLLNIKEFNSLFINLVKLKYVLLEQIDENQTDEKKEQIKPKNININPKYLELKTKSEKNKKYILASIKKINSAENLKLYQKILYNIDYSVNTVTTNNEGLFSRKKTIEIKKEKVKYFHVSQLLFSEKSKKLFSLEQNKFYYHIKELKEKDFANLDKKELIIKNNIIKCKNFLSSILYNYRILEKSDFNQSKTGNIISILKELAYFMNN